MSRHAHVTGVILAGGRARRMGGRDKSRLPLGPIEGDHCLGRIREVFASRFAGTVVVVAAGAPGTGSKHPGATVVVDRFEGCGPLGGLHAGLEAVGTPMAFVCGADMPGLSAALIDHMVARARPGRLLVPLRGGRPEPLHALYPREAGEEAGKALSEGIRMMTDFFARCEVDWLDEADYAAIPGAGASFENLNTPSDLEAFRARRGGDP